MTLATIPTQSRAIDDALVALEQFVEAAGHLAAALQSVQDGMLRNARGAGYDSPMVITPALAPADEALSGEDFRALRQRAGKDGISIATAAKLCGVDPSTVFRWEKGRQRHTHLSKNDGLRRGIEIIRWYVAQYEARGVEMTTAELILEHARREKKRMSTRVA